jgi:hypothetical protein
MRHVIIHQQIDENDGQVMRLWSVPEETAVALTETLGRAPDAETITSSEQAHTLAGAATPTVFWNES